MKKSSFFINVLICFFCILALSFSSVSAQLGAGNNDNTPMSTTSSAEEQFKRQGQQWVCLPVKKCHENGRPLRNECHDRAFQKVSETGQIKEVGDTNAGKHAGVFDVDPDKQMKDQPTYVITCVSMGLTDQDNFLGCTTTNKSNDDAIWGSDNNYLDTLQRNFGYRFEGMYDNNTGANVFNPIAANPPKNTSSKKAYLWKDETNDSQHPRKFYGVNLIPEGAVIPQPSPVVTETITQPTVVQATTAAGEAGALQQGPLDFVSSTSSSSQTSTTSTALNPTTTPNNTNCISIKWDPYGRVFDSQTLEPIKDAEVTLLIKRTDGSFTQMTNSDMQGGILKNPVKTNVDGVFNFVVPEGDYKLTVTHPDYTFPSGALTINSNYSSIYRNIYPIKTGDEIVERIDTPEEKSNGYPNAERRDIPLDPKTVSTSNPISVVEFFYDKDKYNGITQFEGRTSHPFAIVNIYTLIRSAIDPSKSTRSKKITSILTDRKGEFLISVPNSAIPEKEYLGEIEVYKTDLTRSATSVSNATTVGSAFTKQLPPILDKLQGFAYDTTGKTVTNALVNVYLQGSSKPYAVARTDSKGFYKIDTNSTPFLPYYIEYKANDKSVKTTTASFLTQNQTYLDNNKINLNNIRPSSSGPSYSESKKESSTPTDQSLKSPSQKTATLILALIVFVVMIGAIGFFVMNAKRQSSTY